MSRARSHRANPSIDEEKAPEGGVRRGFWWCALEDSNLWTSLSPRDPLDVYPVTMETPTNKSTQRPCGRFAHAAALLVMFSVVLIAPLSESRTATVAAPAAGQPGGHPDLPKVWVHRRRHDPC